MANLFQPSINRAVDSNGSPISGAKLYFYDAGTSTPAVWYTNQAGSVRGTNPLVANSAGIFAPAYLEATADYRVVLKNADESETIYDVSPVPGFDSSQLADSAAAAVDAAADAEAAQAAAEAAEAAAELAQGLAEDARDAAQSYRDAALAGANLFASTAAALGDGVSNYTSLVGGSGGTNGAFDLVLTGGTEVVAAVGSFVVSGGAVTAINITKSGYYSSAPTGFDFSASSGLTGASATPVLTANTGDGDYFQVPSADSTGYIDLYTNNAGVADFVATMPGTAALDDLVTTETVRSGVAIVEDASDKELLGFTDEGDARLNGIWLNRAEPADDGMLEIIQFAAGIRRVLGVDTATGEIDIGALTSSSAQRLSEQLQITQGGGGFGGTINTDKLKITFGHGQSLSIGGGQDYADVTANGTNPVLFYPGSPRALMFSYGLCGSESTAISAGDLGDLVEAREEWNATRGLGQTGGLALMLQKETLRRALGALDYQLYFTHGVGGTQISEIDTGSNAFENGAVALQAAKDLADTYGLTPQFQGTIFWQGNTDRSGGTAQATYEGLLEALQDDLNTQYQDILARATAYPLFVVQLEADTPPSGPANEPGDIAKAQRAVCEANSNCYMVGSPYYVKRIDGQHLTAEGYDWFMESVGWCIHQIDILGDTAFEPCWHTNATRSGTTITVEVNVPNGDLTIDTDSIEEATDYGFTYSGANITSVSVGTTTGGACEITIEIDAATGGTLAYAWNPEAYARGADGAYPHTSAWGNIRDGKGAEVASQTIPGAIVANWLIPFEETVA